MSWSAKLFCFATGRALEVSGGGGGKAWIEKRYGEDGITYLLKGGAKQTGHGIQLFRERLSEKGHATIPKDIVGGFVCPVLQRNLKEWHERPRKYVRKCRWKATRVGSTATVVRNSVLIISLNTFWGCRVRIFSDNHSRNSCILMMEFEQVTKFVVLHLVTNNCCFILRVLITRGRK